MPSFAGRATLALVISIALPARGQTLRVPAGSSEAEIVAAALSEGASSSKVSLSSSDSTARVCTTGRDLGPVRSGDFQIGGNLGGSAAVAAGRPRKIWWAPDRHARNMPPLVVRGRSLTTPTDTLVFTIDKVAWPVTPGAPPIPEAERKYFFPSGFTIPTSGRWLVIATSGSNWGCFILSTHW